MQSRSLLHMSTTYGRCSNRCFFCCGAIPIKRSKWSVTVPEEFDHNPEDEEEDEEDEEEDDDEDEEVAALVFGSLPSDSKNVKLHNVFDVGGRINRIK